MRYIPLPAMAFLLALSPSLSQASPTQSQHDPTFYPILYEIPAMSKVTMKQDVPYKVLAGGASLTMDLYYPPDFKPGTTRPGIVFINGVGDRPDPAEAKLKSWGQYTSWARLMAASGYVAITHEAMGPDPSADIRDLFGFLKREGAKHGLDPQRIGAWACSANVRPAMAYLMGDTGPGILAAVFYYGAGEVPALRADLPVLLVRAGKDGPFSNDPIGRVTSMVAANNAPWTVLNLPKAHHAFDIFDNLQETRDAIRTTISFFDEHLQPRSLGEPAAIAPEREAVGYWFQQDWPKSAEAYQRIMEKDPNDPTVLARLGVAQVNMGRFQDGIPNLERAVVMGESSPQTYTMLGYGYVTAGRYTMGLDYLQRAIDQDWADGRTYNLVGLAHAGLKQYPEAIRSFEHAIELGPVTPATRYNLACMYALSGQNDKAIEALGRAIDAGYRDRNGMLNDPDLAGLKDDARFKELLRRLG